MKMIVATVLHALFSSVIIVYYRVQWREKGDQHWSHFDLIGADDNEFLKTMPRVMRNR